MKELKELIKYESTLMIEMDKNLQWTLYVVVDKIREMRELKELLRDLVNGINLIS